MESKIINMGGDKPLQFIIGIEQSTLIPSFMTTVDELWMAVVGADLYTAINSHQFLCINKNLKDHKDFAATMNITSFKSLMLTGETQRFQDYVFAIIDFVVKNYITPSLTFYITFMSDTSQHAVNAIVELEKGIIMVGAQLGNKLSNMK